MTSKHIHIKDRTRELAEQIYRETVHLEDLQKELKLALATVQSIDLSYTDSIDTCKKIRSLNAHIKKTELLITSLQTEN